MIRISEYYRKIIRKIFRGIGVSVVSLVIQACYGIIPPDEPYAEYGMPCPPDYVQETSIYGKVRVKGTGEPIFGIKVSIEETEYSKRTDENGDFYIYGLPAQEKYKLKFEDVDGTYNGGLFKKETLTLKQSDTYNTLLISMDLDTETNAE
ncbi:MAG: carboxypeptidase-like regulatory domain-containing protein [Treponema sp.]|jgi:hypothetical protein|nr:carboxypeptidase-like regulatory domain-containing protein [Treponema sp.]